MRRKQTKLENNLYELGYRLDHKTYCGKKSEKVDQFVYLKYRNNDTYYVYLNRERTKIEGFAFTSNRYVQYNSYSIEDIKNTYSDFEQELGCIYNFKEERAIELVNPFDLEDVEPPFVEESVLDD